MNYRNAISLIGWWVVLISSLPLSWHEYVAIVVSLDYINGPFYYNTKHLLQHWVSYDIIGQLLHYIGLYKA